LLLATAGRPYKASQQKAKGTKVACKEKVRPFCLCVATVKSKGRQKLAMHLCFLLPFAFYYCARRARLKAKGNAKAKDAKAKED
jgi:hypothetical protein